MFMFLIQMVWIFCYWSFFDCALEGDQSDKNDGKKIFNCLSFLFKIFGTIFFLLKASKKGRGWGKLLKGEKTFRKYQEFIVFLRICRFWTSFDIRNGRVQKRFLRGCLEYGKKRKRLFFFFVWLSKNWEKIYLNLLFSGNLQDYSLNWKRLERERENEYILFENQNLYKKYFDMRTFWVGCLKWKTTLFEKNFFLDAFFPFTQ